MKKTISTIICLGAALLAFTACSDDTETRLAAVPTVALSPSSITLSAEAVGSYTINYTVSNPGEGASVSAAADVSWISGVDASVSGQVRLSVAANTSDEMRTGTVTLTYSYDGGAVTAKAAVVQYGAGDPVLTVDPNAVVASHEGGPYSFGYSIENPIDGESVSCTSDAGWVSGFDYSVYGEVSFTVEASEETELRTATITVSYASLSKEVTVVQDHPSSGSDDDGDGGSGGGDGSLVGTYTAAGYAYAGSGVDAYTTWTLKIYEYDGSVKCSAPNYTGSFDYYIDGICPNAEGMYDYYGDHRLSAAAYVDGSGSLVVPTQVLSTTSSGYYVGWTPAVSKSSTGWSYNYGWPDLTFTYNASSGCWEADYGVFMGAFTTMSLTPGTNSGFYSFFDVVSPGAFQFTKDGDLGDGGGGDYPNYSDMTGTYSCTGYGRISGGYDNTTWDMYVTAKSETEYYVYCLTPYAGGLDIASGGSTYWATGHWGTETTFVVPSQVCSGRVSTSSGTYYLGYTPCTKYEDGSFYYSSQWPDLTFTKTGDDTWESDYGVFAACFSSTSLSSMGSYLGVTAPTVTITKTSSTVPTAISAAAASGRALSAEAYTNLKVSSAPASNTVSVTRALGRLPLGSAKLAK